MKTHPPGGVITKKGKKKKKRKEKITVNKTHKVNKQTRKEREKTDKWNGMKKKKSTQRLPPDTDSHNQHAARGNYISYIYNHYSCREAPPSPLNHGYKLENGKNN